MDDDMREEDPITEVPIMQRDSILRVVWQKLVLTMRWIISVRIVVPTYEPDVDYTESAVVDYIEKELDRAVRSRSGWKAHIKLDPQYQHFPSSIVTLSHKFWRIYKENVPGPCYRLQVTSDLREFLIWFDHQSVGAAPRIERSAVHLPIQLFVGQFAGLGFPKQSLGSVLNTILNNPDKYPMNHYSIT